MPIDRSPQPHVTSKLRPALSKDRAQRLRIAWFVIGALFGLSLGGLLFRHLPIDEATDQATGETEPAAPVAADSGAKPHAEAVGTPAAVEAQAWPRSVEVTVSSGDTMLDLLTGEGLSYQSAQEVMDELKSKFNPRDLKVGHTINMVLDHDDTRQEKDAAQLSQMSIILSNLEQVNIRQKVDGSYETERTRKKITVQPTYGSSQITSSFYLAAKHSGVPDAVILDLIKNYSYDVDFQRDIKVGDRIEVMYESLVTDGGVKAGTGQVLYALLHTEGRDRILYRYKSADGSSRFYNEKGESIIKKLLRTPVDGARISSGFGMRFHPILGYSRMHRGIDFAAPIGTPIYAAGDGVVEYAGPANGYGNLVKIKHNATYATAYGHMYHFAPGIHKGVSVHQGQVIAYVGQAGMATGPHLHYEIIKDGSQVNPAGVQFAGGDKLDGKDLAAFKTAEKQIQNDVARLQNPARKQQVAAN